MTDLTEGARSPKIKKERNKDFDLSILGIESDLAKRICFGGIIHLQLKRDGMWLFECWIDYVLKFCHYKGSLNT